MKTHTNLLIKQKVLLAAMSFLFSFGSYSQNIGINSTGAIPDSSAILDLNTGNTFGTGTSKGFLIPKVALTGINDNSTIIKPANSLLVYHTGSTGLTTAGYYYNAGSTTSPNWVLLLASNTGGTVTSVSVTTANGVSGTVATATTTPAISLTLGDITPTSVAATGTVTGSNLSGTNTGNQTITLTGDVTGSGTGSFSTTLANSGVTAATYGSATQVPVFAVDVKGRVTSVTNTTISSTSRDCPSGFTQVNAQYCIQTSENAAGSISWYNASATCVANGYQLCSWAQWYGACANVSALQTSMTNGWEWVDNAAYAESADNLVMVVLGGTSSVCTSASRAYPSSTFTFRCCFNR